MTGATRMAVVPQTQADIAALSVRSGIGFDTLMNLDDLELGLVIHDENARNEHGDEILRVITRGAGEAGVNSAQDKVGRPSLVVDQAAPDRQGSKPGLAGRGRTLRRRA